MTLSSAADQILIRADGGVILDRQVAQRPDIVVRPALPSDLWASELVYHSAPTAFAALAGSAGRARAILADVWSLPGHSASFEFAWIAETNGRPAGVIVAFPARSRYRIHGGLWLRGLRALPAWRWPLLTGALWQLAVQTPRPPRRSFYIAAIAVVAPLRNHGVGSGLVAEVELRARDAGFKSLAAATGSRYLLVRSALEHRGFRVLSERPRGYVMYVKDLADDDKRPAEVHPDTTPVQSH